MNGSCKRPSLDLHDTTKICKAWKSRMCNIIQKQFLRKKINRRAANERSPESLELLLSHKSGQTAFRDFLKSEFCEENLDFWLACQQFKCLDSVEELRRRATHIYKEFIEAESPTQINIDFYTKEVIRQNLHHPSPLIFTVAQKKIYSLMENGSFPRFIQSEQYKVLFDATSQHRGLGKHQKVMRIKCVGELIENQSVPHNLRSDLFLFYKD